MIARCIIAASAALSLLSACGRPDGYAEPPYPGTECGIASDQFDSFMPRMESRTAVQVTIDERFREDDRGILTGPIETALESWNRVSQSARGRSFFAPPRYARINRNEASPAGESDCGFGGSDRARFQIIREDRDEEWASLGLDESVPGVTVRCYESNRSRLTKQVILLNTRHVSRHGIASQFTGITFHEVGHSIGLDHSCSFDKASDRWADCSELNQEHPYYRAIMYPIFRLVRIGSRTDAVKQSLRKNDMDRGYCLYRGL